MLVGRRFRSTTGGSLTNLRQLQEADRWTLRRYHQEQTGRHRRRRHRRAAC